MEIGNDDIDNDHRYLISLINTIEAAGNCHVQGRIFQEHVNHLSSYAHEHFEREEGIQNKIRYPQSEVHKKLHENLGQRLQQIIKSINVDENERVRLENMWELIDILRDWLIVHVLTEDRKMREFIKRV